MKHLILNMLLLVVLFGQTGPSRVAAQTNSIEFRNATVENLYPDRLTFRIEVCGVPSKARVKISYTTDYASETTSWWYGEDFTFSDGRTPDGCEKRRHHVHTKDEVIPPFSRIEYYWSVSDDGREISRSPSYFYFYRDPDHRWATLGDRYIMVRWHDRPESFAQDVMSIASIAYREQAEFYDGSLNVPLTIVITNTEDEFAAWQSDADYAAGMAFPESYLTIQVVEDEVDYQDWLSDVIPHEISHIYFGRLIEKQRYLPRWLDEGIATYLEYSDHWDEWLDIQDAHDAGGLRPLEELEESFGDNDADIYFGYAQSYYAILYMDEVYGKESISTLLQEYRRGGTPENAFDKAFGVSPKQFGSDYLAWLETRIETAPPSTKLPSQTPLTSGTDALWTVYTILCLSALWFFGFGAGGIAVLWVLNELFSGKEKKKTLR